ncbi:MAG: 30S ribosomal protein S5 [Armatimonadota bacterium]
MRFSMQGSRRDLGNGVHSQVANTRRVSKTHKGGKTPSWSCLVVVGDNAGKVGVAIGKARGVPDAIRKGEDAAVKKMISVPLVGRTIPHHAVGKMGATTVLLKPASPGTGVVAGGAVRVVLELAGVSDVLAKTLGSRTAVNCAYATIDALQQLVVPEERASIRGLTPEEVTPWLAKVREEEAQNESPSQVDSESNWQ